MLGKLIKYDILADWKKYAIVFASTLLLSLTVFILERDMSAVQNNAFLLIVDHFVSGAFIIMTVATAVIVFVFAIMRFYKNLVRDEGYLMHTLPVHTWQLIASKLITVYIWSAASVIVLMISTGIITGKPLWFFDFIGSYSEFLAEINEIAGENIDFIKTFMLYGILSVLLSPLFLMSHTYFSLALGNLASSRKLGIAVLAFFAINIAEQIISAVIMSVNASDMIIPKQVSDMQVLSFINNSMFASIIISTALSLGMLVGAERIFAKKLNLE